MFELSFDELTSLRSQSVTLKRGQHSKYPPFAFTEQGVAMLSSVLRSERAIEVNIQIIRAFVKIRQLFLENEEIKKELFDLKNISEERFQIVFETLDRLLEVKENSKKPIGFTVKEKLKEYGLN